MFWYGSIVYLFAFFLAFHFQITLSMYPPYYNLGDIYKNYASCDLGSPALCVFLSWSACDLNCIAVYVILFFKYISVFLLELACVSVVVSFINVPQFWFVFFWFFYVFTGLFKAWYLDLLLYYIQGRQHNNAVPYYTAAKIKD